MNAMPPRGRILHDDIEDTSVTVQDLRDLGFSDEILTSRNYR